MTGTASALANLLYNTPGVIILLCTRYCYSFCELFTKCLIWMEWCAKNIDKTLMRPYIKKRNDIQVVHSNSWFKIPSVETMDARSAKASQSTLYILDLFPVDHSVILQCASGVAAKDLILIKEAHELIINSGTSDWMSSSRWHSESFSRHP